MRDSGRYTIGLVLLGVTLITVALVVRLVVSGDEMTTLTEPVSQKFSTSDSPQLVIETFDGAIEVKVGGADEVAVTVVRKGSGLTESAAFDALSTVQVRLTQEGDTVRVRAWREDGGSKLSSSGASIEITAPAGARLELVTSNGRVATAGFAGPITARSSNGTIELGGVASTIIAETSNGGVTINASGASVIRATTSNGSLRFSGSLVAGESVFATSNGSILVELPADSAFSLDASTSNGKISSDFPMTSGGQSPTRVEGTFGEARGVALRAETTNGKIEVRRK